MKKTELLIPVGNQDCLNAAINNGADAVYLGGKKFGARAYSNNFNDEEMISAIKLCHLHNVKIYVTVNTMIFNEEVEEVINYLKFLYENNVDAVIMQDLGMINLTRKLLPNLEIHVSTQAHNHNQEGISYYAKIGCQRVVFDRESSLDEIKEINVPIEKEIFVYGSLCICYSGNCLFSALNGGRSANRGMCVGSCRLPYYLIRNNKTEPLLYYLSTKDLNTLPYLKDILNSKIDSLKVEGRMKSKEYVAIVTKTYRQLIDNYYNNTEPIFTPEMQENLMKTYNRGYTKGYLMNAQSIINNQTSNHQGIKIGQVIKVTKERISIKLEKELHQGDAIRFKNTQTGMYVNTLYNTKNLLIKSSTPNTIIEVENKDHLNAKDLINSVVLKTIDKELNDELNNAQAPKIPITISFQAKLNQPMKITIKETKYLIEKEGSVVEFAKSQPITKERITEQLLKLGSTTFIGTIKNIDIDSNIFINIKDLNELRRQAIDDLITQKEGYSKEISKITLPKINEYESPSPKISILTRNEKQLLKALSLNIDYIYVTDENIYQKFHSHSNVYLRLERVMNHHPQKQNERFLCTELGSIVAYSQNNEIRSDYYLNIANDYSLNTLKKLNVKAITLSVEISLSQLENIQNKKDSEIIIYGTPECMIIKNDILNTTQDTVYLDHKGSKYQVTCQNNFTHIYNSKKINLLNNLINLRNFGTWRIELLDETPEEIDQIINKCRFTS